MNVIYGRITMWHLGPILTRQVYGTSFTIHRNRQQLKLQDTVTVSECKICISLKAILISYPILLLCFLCAYTTLILFLPPKPMWCFFHL